MPGKSFRVTLGAPTEGVTEAIAAIRVEESADGQSAWSEIQTTPVAALIDEGAGRLRLDAPAADQTAYHRLVPITASGVERQASTIHPPLPTTPETFTVFAWTVDAGLGVKSGVSFSARPKGAHTAAGARLVVAQASVSTDAGGYAALTLPADAGILRLALGPVSAEVDTTGRAGQVINLKDLV